MMLLLATALAVDIPTEDLRALVADRAALDVCRETRAQLVTELAAANAAVDRNAEALEACKAAALPVLDADEALIDSQQEVIVALGAEVDKLGRKLGRRTRERDMLLGVAGAAVVALAVAVAL